MKKLQIFLVSSVFMPMTAFAQQGRTVFDEQSTLPGATDVSGGTLLGIMQGVVDWIFTALLVAAVIMILIAAFRYLFAGGESDAISKANKMLLYAAVAIAVALLAQTFIFLIETFVISGGNI